MLKTRNSAYQSIRPYHIKLFQERREYYVIGSVFPLGFKSKH